LKSQSGKNGAFGVEKWRRDMFGNSPYCVPAMFLEVRAQNLKICSRQAKTRKKRVLKVKRANPDLDIFEKIPFYPF